MTHDTKAAEPAPFPNRAGDHADTDEILRAELRAAGIQTIQEAEGKPPEYRADFLRRNSGEVKTSVIGVLHGWEFKRSWRYWVCKGPGIELEAAERLHATHGRTVRVAGHCGSPSPREWFKGLACDSYHVDDAEGLRALADCIKGMVDRAALSVSTQAPEAQALDVVARLDDEACTLLNALMQGDDGELSPITLQVGDGHSGRGLYASLTEYPEEGAVFLCAADAAASPAVERDALYAGTVAIFRCDRSCLHTGRCSGACGPGATTNQAPGGAAS